jgi:hypothetical protein
MKEFLVILNALFAIFKEYALNVHKILIEPQLLNVNAFQTTMNKVILSVEIVIIHVKFVDLLKNALNAKGIEKNIFLLIIYYI